MSGAEQRLLEVAGRMTSRDRWMFAMLHEHRVLTSHHLTRLAFDGDRMARMRLATLHRLQTVDRMRPYYGQGRGTGPYHYMLGPVGAAILAAGRGQSVADLGYRRDKLHAWVSSPRLGHLVGVNAVFTAWVYASRTRPDNEGLTVWWSERRAAALWRQWIRPDGYGTWQAGQRRLDFFVEFDTGTESLSQIARKIPGYTRLAASSGLTSPVLIWLPVHLPGTGTARPARRHPGRRRHRHRRPRPPDRPDDCGRPARPRPRPASVAAPAHHHPHRPRRTHHPLRHPDPHPPPSRQPRPARPPP
ncbi:replication-relaxation family protein [Parafrankia discariae]|uniref:replication-relaxation family protein n=1 Tax=Parafrankia discariae TaxID=365528 RepID=UPI00039CC23C|nr:replication-relaxation family protein [Parafrankia discariae]